MITRTQINKRIRFLEARIAEERSKSYDINGVPISKPRETPSLNAMLAEAISAARPKKAISIRRWGHYHFTREHIAVNERVESTCEHPGDNKTGVGFCLKHTKIVPGYDDGKAIDTRTLDMDDKYTEEVVLARCVEEDGHLIVISGGYAAIEVPEI